MTELPPGASPVDAIAPGTRLREWEIVRFVGRGSYGVVFEARRSSWLDEPPRALKVFDPIISSAARSALLDEFATLTGMRHPNLLAGIDAFDPVEPPFAGCVVFVLELADEDLAHRVARSGPLPPSDAAAVLADVADGLAALHARGRIHGDVKPENILRVGDRWVLGDFGVTSVLEGSYAVTRGATVDYRPPELAHATEGGLQHRSTDIWALGVSLHVAAAGRHPFPGPDPMMRYAAVVRGDRTPAPGLDPALAALIDDGCLVADPHRRLGAADLAARLRARSHHSLAAAVRPSPGGSPGAPASPAPSPPSAADTASAPSSVPAPAPVSTPAATPAPAPGSTPAPVEPAAPGSTVTRSAIVLGLAALASLVLSQVVAVACGALLSDVGARRVAYVAVSLVVLGLGAVWASRRRRSAPPQPALLIGVALGVWLVATIILFV